MEKGYILKQLRIEKALTQKNMADFLCISASAYGYYEQERNQMDYKTLIKLSEFFNVTIGYLIKGKAQDIPLLSRIEYEHIRVLRSLPEVNRNQIYAIAKEFSKFR
jgi:transcriptional regulator with XRE-family HTH domain